MCGAAGGGRGVGRRNAHKAAGRAHRIDVAACRRAAADDEHRHRARGLQHQVPSLQPYAPSLLQPYAPSLQPFVPPPAAARRARPCPCRGRRRAQWPPPRSPRTRAARPCRPLHRAPAGAAGRWCRRAAALPRRRSSGAGCGSGGAWGRAGLNQSQRVLVCPLPSPRRHWTSLSGSALLGAGPAPLHPAPPVGPARPPLPVSRRHTWRSGDDESCVGRNSTKRQTSGEAAARWTAAAMPMPLFQQCGATLLPFAAAIRQTRRASVRPPTRPASGCSTCAHRGVRAGCVHAASITRSCGYRTGLRRRATVLGCSVALQCRAAPRCVAAAA